MPCHSNALNGTTCMCIVTFCRRVVWCFHVIALSLSLVELLLRRCCCWLNLNMLLTMKYINILRYLLIFRVLDSIDELQFYYYCLWISPLLLEHVALRMGNLQVAKTSRGIASSVLGLWYVTGWGIVTMFSFIPLCIEFWNMLSEFYYCWSFKWCWNNAYDCWWPLCQFIEVVNVENKFSAANY